MCDAVSCQFAAHYAFYSRRSANRFLDNVARLLKPGGVLHLEPLPRERESSNAWKMLATVGRSSIGGRTYPWFYNLY